MTYLKFLIAYFALVFVSGSSPAAFNVLLAIGAVMAAYWVWTHAVARGKEMPGGEAALRDVGILLVVGMIVYAFIVLALVLGIGLALVLDTWLPPLRFSAALTVCYAVLVLLFAVISLAESQPNFPRTGDFPPSTFGFFILILNPIGFFVAQVMIAIWAGIAKGNRWRLPDGSSGDVGFLAVLGIVGTAIWFGEMYGLALLLNWMNSE